MKTEFLKGDLEVKEGPLSFQLSKGRLQKVGFYYDHRENREKLSSALCRADKNFLKGLDLFCYAGAWGMTMAKSGVESVDFVDQADFEADFKSNLRLNGLEGEHIFSAVTDLSTLRGKKIITISS